MKREKIFSLLGLIFIVAAIVFYKGNSEDVFSKLTKKKLPIYYVDTEEKKVAITFDASWGADKTDKILDILDKYEIKATFFLVGRWVDEFEDKVKEIHNRGHELGNHSNSHPMMTNLSKVDMLKEIQITDGKIMKITGERLDLFRCPSGAYNDNVLDVLKESGHFCIQWDVDSIDWKAEGAQKEYNRVIQKVKPGSIVLFHNDAKYTPENLPKIIEKLLDEGYKFVKVSDLIYKEDFHIDYSGKQIKN